ncbi:YciI family protein [Streptomyces coeruleoprunus]|uniref:YciI family protein n=1 Tax=Streptomyces coeruleoprunus TaxID=285563 RepID=A0ABV9XIN3_9ACTN
MYVALLRFSANKSAAAEYMAEHQNWIRQGVEDGVFLLVGSIQPGQGGAVLATGVTLEEFQARVAEDPFVIHDVVAAEVIEIAPNLTDPRLAFLKD